MLSQDFSFNLRNLLQRNGFTQADLAAGIGLTSRSVSLKVTGRRPWDSDQMDACAAFLGVPTLTLLRPVPASKEAVA